MARLTEEQISDVKEHMCSDETKLKALYNAKKKPYDECSVSFNEAEDRKKEGWEVFAELKRKVKMQRPKATGVAFEDKIWSMFYALGFRNLNRNEHLELKWGEGEGDHKQIDVLAVGEKAVFVVECKAASKVTTRSFKSIIDGIEHYREGVISSLKQIYGDKIKVKFILATDNYRIGDEDTKRMNEKKIFHLNENAYKYIQGLLKSYKSCVSYQFYGMMFKNELITSNRISVPALKGKMGKFDYYMMSIEPEILLRMGFVLHRTKVNDSMAPTYQRLLSAKRLPGITKFINNGGYFPNSVIVNFDTTQIKGKIQFDLAKNSSEDSEAQLGTLRIPDAYGIAYIIDGQHRLYGYAGTEYRKTNTIPVVAFLDMESKEQLKIFMDINENQKSVSKNLRLDLEEDINWDSPFINSRIKALRSSIIKYLAVDSGSVLANKISVGEDSSELNFSFFDDGLKKSSLLPQATKKSYNGDTDVCMYDTKNLDHDKAMNECKKSISSYLRECYNYVYGQLDEMLFKDFIMCNRGTYAFVALVGSLNKHLIKSGRISQFETLDYRMKEIKPYLDILINYLSNLPAADENELRIIQGGGAQTTWLCRFQNSIHSEVPEFNPDGLDTWLKNQDSGLQQKGKYYVEKIFDILKDRIVIKLEDLYGDNWESSVNDIKKDCWSRLVQQYGDEEDFDLQDFEWTDAIELDDIKSIIEKNWTQGKESDKNFLTFKREFSINVNDKFSTKQERLAWLDDLMKLKKIVSNPKGGKLTHQQVNEMELIYSSLNPES